MTVIICFTWSVYSIEILIDFIINQIFQMTEIFFNQLIFSVSGSAICQSAGDTKQVARKLTPGWHSAEYKEWEIIITLREISQFGTMETFRAWFSMI